MKNFPLKDDFWCFYAFFHFYFSIISQKKRNFATNKIE